MEEGILNKAGRISVLELGGSYRRMGRQYGALLKDRLSGFYETAIEGYFIKKEKLPYLKLLAISRLLFRRYPPECKELLNGMSETSGLSLNRLIMLDSLNAFELIRNQKIGHCSNISAWGDYSERGILVIGRNFDQPEFFKEFNDFIVLAVFSPEAGIPTANIGYAGQIGINAAMNKQGVFIANNEAPVLKGDAIDINVPNVLVAEFGFLLRSSDLGGLDKCIMGARSNCPIIVSAADAKNAYTYEWTVPDIKRRSGYDNGLMIATNHFTDPSWKRPVPKPGAYGMTGIRLDNLASLGKRYKGRFNTRSMRELLDIALDDGGATHSDKTIFQLVAVPEELKFHLKIPGFQDWTEVDLSVPFNRYESTGDFELSIEKV